jgi:hypothetical protein
MLKYRSLDKGYSEMSNMMNKLQAPLCRDAMQKCFSNRQLLSLPVVIVLAVGTAMVSTLFVSGASHAVGVSTAVSNSQRYAREKEKKDRFELAKASPREIIHRNAQAFENKDLGGYMATIDPDAPTWEDTKHLASLIMNSDLELTMEIVSFDVLPAAEPDRVRIRVKQYTKKIAGSDRFVDNEVEAIHILRKTKDGWKIHGSEVIGIDLL